MKIEKGYAAYEATKVTKQPLPPTSQEAKTAKKSIETTKSVDVDLSQASKAIKQQVTSLEASPVRADKVAAIKAAIKQGTYEISPEKIAKSMLEE
ncbi:flagellar biosynthesis anti-sigma factor FlgM [Enterococcus bulliens]